MKKIIFLSVVVLISTLTFGQKVKIKKDLVYIDKIEYCKIIKESGKTTLSTLNGTDFALIEINSYGSGNFDPNTNKEIYVKFSEISFLGQEIPWFDMNEVNVSDIIVELYKGYILEDGELNVANAKKFYEANKDTCVPIGRKVKRERK